MFDLPRTHLGFTAALLQSLNTTRYRELTDIANSKQNKEVVTNTYEIHLLLKNESTEGRKELCNKRRRNLYSSNITEAIRIAVVENGD